MTWDLEAEIEATKRHQRPQNRYLAMMAAYNRDLELAGAEFARSKTDHDRMLARRIVAERAGGERSAEVAAHKAIAESDEVYLARLSYRLAEQRIVADRAHLARLHSALDDLRTQAADARAASEFHAADPSAA